MTRSKFPEEQIASACTRRRVGRPSRMSAATWRVRRSVLSITPHQYTEWQ